MKCLIAGIMQRSNKEGKGAAFRTAPVMENYTSTDPGRAELHIIMAFKKGFFGSRTTSK
jgi:hypothetical protein